MLRASFSGASLIRNKNGNVRLILTLAGIILLQFGYALKLLHLTGSEPIIVVATSITVIALLSNTYVAFRHAPVKETMLTFLHEKYTSNIERFLSILLAVMATAKTISITTTFQVPGASAILLIIIFGSGLHFIVMIWRILEHQVLFRRTVFLLGIAVISVCLPLPFLGEMLPWEIRVVSIIVFTAISAWLSFRMQQQPEHVVPSIMVVLVPFLFIIWTTVKFHILPIEFHKYVFNLPVLSLLVAGLLLSKKHDTMRSFMIISLGGYLIEYPT
jgi:hypothetical protein